jgi:hypothetical protein
MAKCKPKPNQSFCGANFDKDLIIVNAGEQSKLLKYIFLKNIYSNFFIQMFKLNKVIFIIYTILIILRVQNKGQETFSTVEV